MGKKKKKKKRNRKKLEKSLASCADPYELYQQAVQSPAADIEFFTERFSRLRGREPVTLKEDFCGTALFSCEWVRSHPKRRALGVDFDAPTLAWGHEINRKPLKADERGRLALVCADVLDIRGPRVDLTCAMNFSFCVFKNRKVLQRYLKMAHDGLGTDGVFICELYGGTEAIVELEEEREVDDFTFRWEQQSYNPINHETRCHIHFEMADGSRIRRAFTYDWRLWSIPEVRELLAEAGFANSTVFWEEVDEDGDGTGSYIETEEEENQEGWLVYIVAAK